MGGSGPAERPPAHCRSNPLTQIPPLFAWRSGAREQFEVKDGRYAVAASGGGPEGAVLEFELLSRIIASMQSMEGWRS